MLTPASPALDAVAPRLMFVSRLMSGFADSLRDGIWRPTGAPAICRLMDRLAEDLPQTRFFLLCRESGFDFRASWTATRDRDVALNGFPAKIRVLAGAHFFPAWFGRWRGHLAELRQLLVLIVSVMRHRPDAIYFERGCALAAGVVARLFPGRVVLRLLGILPWMQHLATSRSPYHRLLRWAYRAPFGLVVCSDDGSGGAAWMERHLQDGVPRVTLLNGVDPQPAEAAHPALDGMPADATVVLMLGRLESLRHCEDFVAALLGTQADARLHALIVGDGPLRPSLEAMVASAGAGSRFTFTGALSRTGVAAALGRADIYVMLNDMCCLTNTTLEALRAGLCPVVLDPPAYLAGDPATERLLPPTVAVRLARDPAVPIARSLGEALGRLASDPAERARRAAGAREIAERDLVGWPTRISREVAMISRVAAGLDPLAAKA